MCVYRYCCGVVSTGWLSVLVYLISRTKVYKRLIIRSGDNQ